MELTPSAKLAQIRVGLPSEEDVWFSPQEGLNLLYGRNGSGKSTIIDALSNIFLSDYQTRRHSLAEKSPKNSPVTAYFEVGHVVVFNLLNLYIEQFIEFLTERGIKVPKIEEVVSDGTVSLVNDLNATDPFDGWSYFDISGGLPNFDDVDFVEHFNEWRVSVDGGITEEGTDHDDIGTMLLRGLRDGLNEHGGEILRSTSDCRALFNQLRDGLRDAYSNEYSEITTEYANTLLEKFGLETRLEDSALADRSLHGSSWSELLELYLVLMAHDFELTLERRAEFWDDSNDVEDMEVSVKTAAPSTFELAKKVLFAFESQLEQPTFWIEYGDDEWSRIGLALGRSSESIIDSESQESIVQIVQKIREGLDGLRTKIDNVPDDESWGALDEFARHNQVLFLSGPLALLPIGRYRLALANKLYIDLKKPGFLFTGTPIKGILLDREVDTDLVARKTFSNLIRFELRSALFELGEDEPPIDEIEFFESSLEPVNKFVSDVSRFLRSLDIGILECKFDFPMEVRDWALGRSAEFRFCVDPNNPRGIKKSELSSGQQYWVNAAFQICYAEQANVSYLILADEPERGLHQRAVLSAFMALSNTSATSIIATHSVAALSLAGTNLLHLDRGFDGRVQITEPYLGEDVTRAAERFGTTTFDLLAIKRALIVVEGAHDVEVVRGLAGLASGGMLLDRLIVVPARGVKNVATVADSAVITEFTNLHILAITDNGRSEVLQAALNRGMEALSQGKNSTQAVIAARISDLLSGATPEERFMLDLIERAIHRRIAHRLHIFSLSVPDIVDLLPEESFGLTKTWAVLRSEHRKSGSKDNFKAWLKSEYGTSISSKTVKRAFESLDAVDGELRRILEELEIVASLGPLEN